MNWRGIRCFVTGADGFIGSHLAEALVENGAEVTAMAQYNSMGSYGWLDDSKLSRDMRLVHGDVRDTDDMQFYCGNTGSAKQDVVFHLAALVSVPHSSHAPRSYFETNVTGTMNVLKAGQHCQRIVQTSSSEVYGTALVTPILEGHRMFPQSPYAASKVGADAIARSFHTSYDTPVVTLRPFNTYGPRQSERAIMAALIRQDLDSRCSHIKVGNVDARRDLTYVEDTVKAFMAVGDPSLHVAGEVYNCGWGDSISIGELITKITDKPVQFEDERLRNNDVMELVAGCHAINRDTGWQAEVTLEEGVAKTKKWWKYHMSQVKREARYAI